MKKLVLTVLLVVSLFSVVFSETLMSEADYETAERLFVEFRKVRDVDGMKKLIDELESFSATQKDAKLLTVLADACVEYSNWGAPAKEKEKLFEKGRKYAEEAIKLDQKNGRAWYIAGAAIGRLAQYKGIIQSLFMLGDFDKYINKAIEILDDPLYKSFALIASGMRYRDVPWPLYNYSESEKRLKEALKYTPNYPNIYLELGLLYVKMGKKDQAKEMFEKVINSQHHPLLIKIHEEAVNTAKEELKKLK